MSSLWNIGTAVSAPREREVQLLTVEVKYYLISAVRSMFNESYSCCDMAAYDD